MKFYTPEKTVLMDVTAVKRHPDGLLIEGKIMGAMPLKAILTPRELRGAWRLVNLPIILRALGMLFRRPAR
jgi:hypothetical protein